jgi:hypothetical protein
MVLGADDIGPKRFELLRFDTVDREQFLEDGFDAAVDVVACAGHREFRLGQGRQVRYVDPWPEGRSDQRSELRWDDEDNRTTAPLGKIAINAIAPDATCNAFSFLPGNLADGIAGPKGDPVFAARSPVYVVSLIRRKAP